MVAIPAASIQGVNLALVRERFPEKADEIERIGDLLRQGKDSEGEFLGLCRLLFEVGEVTKSEALLRANASESDAVHALYLKLYGTKAEEFLLHSIAVFQGQFGVQLKLHNKQNRYLNWILRCEDFTPSPPSLPTRVMTMLSGVCHVQICYLGPDEIVADVYKVEPPESTESVPLRLQDDKWVVEQWFQELGGDNANFP